MLHFNPIARAWVLRKRVENTPLQVFKSQVAFISFSGLFSINRPHDYHNRTCFSKNSCHGDKKRATFDFQNVKQKNISSKTNKKLQLAR